MEAFSTRRRGVKLFGLAGCKNHTGESVMICKEQIFGWYKKSEDRNLSSFSKISHTGVVRRYGVMSLFSRSAVFFTGQFRGSWADSTLTRVGQV